MSRNEKEVERHQAYQDACAAFQAWMRNTREKFSTCSDTYGDKVTITTKQDRIKVCLVRTNVVDVKPDWTMGFPNGCSHVLKKNTKSLIVTTLY